MMTKKSMSKDKDSKVLDKLSADYSKKGAPFSLTVTITDS
jgi:hypothetical protein